MTNLRSIAAGIVLAAALATPSVHAQEVSATSTGTATATGPGAWDSKYGMIFSVQNVFQNNSDAVIGDFGGGIGLQYNLAPQRALRISVDLARASNPATTSESTNLVTGTKTETFVDPGLFTSRYDVDVGALYVMRLSPTAIAPYLGFGGGIGYVQQARKFENDVPATTVTNVDDMHRSFSLNAAGVLGVEWRVHKSVGLFAEYGLGLDLVTYSSSKTETRTNNKADGVLLAGTKTEGSSTKFFNFDTGLGQGGQIGLVAFF